ncbi:hypothetical protein OG320_05235 [Microbispora sp. NBC_01189]|uniref:hypothetical protein n=1 Tax=Microbispora sp. NBC_01189 TaxID=2903583 RepID=UPI002E0FF990|nr:hypothetical protein OG320_05235 [Microbispora sp. NBC_01189]
MEVLTSADVNTYLMQQVIIRCTSTTRPSSPSEGWHIYETDTRRFLVYRSGSWVREGEIEMYAVKPSDETTSVTSMHNDPHLVLPLAASRTYWMDALLMVSGTSSGHNCVATWSVPSGASMLWASNHPVLDDPGVISVGGNRVNKRWYDQTGSINIRTSAGGGMGTTNAVYMTRMRGILTTGSTVGNLQFQWRASVGTITVHELSALRVQAIIG